MKSVKLFLGIVIIALGSSLANGVIIQPTPSMFGTVYVESESQGEVVKNDLVQFEMTHPLILGGEPTMLLKRIVCMPNDVLKIDKTGWVTCNDLFLGIAATRTSSDKSKKLEAFQYNGVIPDGKVFVMGDHPESFDSRYYGLIDIDSLTKVRNIF